MRLHVDRERCQGHNRCHALAPDLFELDDLGYASASNGADLDGADVDRAELAAVNCPEEAITLSGPDTS